MARARVAFRALLETWNLKRVPFPAIPFVDPFHSDPLRNGSVFDEELRLAEIGAIRRDVLKQGFTSDLKVWNWVWARRNMGRNVGMGKTALLTYIADQINRDYGTKFFGRPANWLAIYVPIQPKTKSVAEMAALGLAGICNNVRGTSVEELLLAQLRRKVLVLGLVGEYPPRVHDAQARRFLDARWMHDNGVNTDGLTSAVEQHLRERGVSAEFARALATCTLRGYFEQLGGDANLIPPKGRLLKAAISLLTNDFARAVYAADIKQVTMLLDDFYYLVRNTAPSEREGLAAELREVAISGSVTHFSVQRSLFYWIAVMHTQTAPKFRAAWESRDMHVVAPLNFDAATSIVLHALPIAQGPAMLETYLASQRVRRMPDGAHPYTAKALAVMVDIAAADAMTLAGSYEPRNLLQAANYVTSRALDLNLQAPIGPEHVEHILKGTPMPTVAVRTADDEEEPNTERSLGGAAVCPCDCHSDGEAPAYDVVATIEGSTGSVLGHYCATCMKNIPDSA